MGEASTSLLEAAVEGAGELTDGTTSAPRGPRRIRRVVAVAVVAALVIAASVVGGVTWANQVAHDRALEQAQAAQEKATRSAAAHRATIVWLETSVDAGIAARDAVASGVIAHQELLGGKAAVSTVVESNAALEALLADVLGAEAPTVDTVIPHTTPIGAPDAIDPELGTDELTSLAASRAEESRDTDAARELLAAEADGVDEANAVLIDALSDLATTLPTPHEALLASHPLASDQSKAAAAAALASLADASSGAGLPALFDKYADAAAGVIAAHDAETARIAAEAAARAAAEAAAKKARSGSRGAAGGGGGGGGGGGDSGVLSETNAQRAANGLGGLAWNGTLASRSCSFAAVLAAANGGLYHSSFQGGFSRWAENVAYGYGSASAVVAGWMGSSGHRANILGPYTVMGACSATSSTGRVYWVQQFGA